MHTQANPDAADLRRLAERVADRLRHLSPTRLAAVEDEVHPLVQQLAALAVAAERLPPRPLASPSARAWGDQVAVLATDLADALEQHPSAELGPRGYDVLVRLRRVLP